MRLAPWTVLLLLALLAPTGSALVLQPDPERLPDPREEGGPLYGCYATFFASDDGRLMRNPQTGGQEVFVGVDTAMVESAQDGGSPDGGSYTGAGVGAYPCEILGDWIDLDPNDDEGVVAGLSNERLDMS